MNFWNMLSHSRNLYLTHAPTLIAALSISTFHGLQQQMPSVHALSYNRAINNFIKSDLLDSAIRLFDEMPEPDVVSWNSMINGYARCGFPERALNLLKEMVCQGIRENPSTFSSVLGICSDARFYEEALQLHCRCIFLGYDSNLFVGSALVDIYMKNGFPHVALKIFDELPERSIATWNLVIQGLCELGRPNMSLDFFLKMKSDGIDANGITFSSLIRGCSNGGFLDQGKQLHCYVIKLGWIHENIFIVNALVDLYSACRSLVDAKRSFDSIHAQDVISWNSIVSIHADNGLLLEALQYFSQMQSWGMKPSVRSFVGFLNLSARTKNLPFGEQIHGLVQKLGFDCSSSHIQCSLIDMYGKCNKIQSSFLLFHVIPKRIVECFNSFITSLLHCNILDEVMDAFGLMVEEEIRPDFVTFSLMLKALSSSISVSLMNCQLLHCGVIKVGYESSIEVSCSLIDAYARGGCVEHSHQIFTWISAPNVICYTAIITGYARNGQGKKCLEMFESMIEKGLKPDAVTLLCVLMGCDHSGLVEEGQSLFQSMEHVHGVSPDGRHYSCMVNLLGRAGLLEAAKETLKLAPAEGVSVMWSSLLGSCRVHGNKRVGKIAARALMDMEPEDPAAYLQASHFYKEIGDSENLEEVREKMMIRKMQSAVGYSLIEVKDQNCFDRLSIQLNGHY